VARRLPPVFDTLGPNKPFSSTMFAGNGQYTLSNGCVSVHANVLDVDFMSSERLIDRIETIFAASSMFAASARSHE